MLCGKGTGELKAGNSTEPLTETRSPKGIWPKDI